MSKNKIIIITLFISVWIITYLQKFNEKLYNHLDYIGECMSFDRISKTTHFIKQPYFSIVIIVYNMEKYLDRAILSVLKQSFQNFEVIIIDDYSSDKSSNIIKKYILLSEQIQAYFHSKNMGIYSSRVDGILKAKGNYILYIDPDDMIINKDLLKIIYYYNLKYNLDLIEFKVDYQDEGRFNLYIRKEHELNHFHNQNKQIISQPELSNIAFYIPRTKNQTYIICRSIWNKVVKRNIVLKSINFIGEKIYKNFYFNFAEDTILNLLNFQFAENYSNINIEGYMYLVREKSASHGEMGLESEMIRSKSLLIYLQLFVQYLIYFNKDRNFFYFELNQFKNYLLFIIKNDLSEKKEVYNLLEKFLSKEEIIKDYYLISNT